METSQLICVENWLTAFFVMRELRVFRLSLGLLLYFNTFFQKLL